MTVGVCMVKPDLLGGGYRDTQHTTGPQLETQRAQEHVSVGWWWYEGDEMGPGCS